MSYCTLGTQAKRRTRATKKRALLIATTCAAACLVPATSAAAAVLHLPDVTAEMSQASYWTGKQADADAVLADRSTIDALNQAGIDASGTGLQPLKTASGTYYDADRQKTLKDAAAAELAGSFVGKAYNENDELFTQADADAILANYPTDGAVPSVASPYAVVTAHTTARAYPTDAMVLDDPGDYDFDNLYLSAVRVNEPLIIRAVSNDGRFFFAICSCLTGWVPAQDVAACSDRDEWLGAWDIPEGDELVIWGYKVRTEDSRTTPQTANRMLYMGTVLERADATDASKLVGNRSVYGNHVCYLPVRNDDGTYSKQAALIAESAKVSEGYLPLTKDNTAKVAFGALGQAYGWGGMLNANDCSGYVRDVYKCFGLELARNTTWQMNLPVAKYDLSGLDDAHKAAAIKQMPLGTVLFFNGHEMLYLGNEGDKLYVVSSVSSIGNLFGESGTNRVRGVVVNTLDLKRGNKTSWLSNLNCANIPYIPASEVDADLHDVAFYTANTTWPKAKYVQTGSALEPGAAIDGLSAGTDYTVGYSGNVKPGTAKVTIAGAGAYTGKTTSTFTVLPKGVSVKSASGGKKQAKVTWAKGLVGATGYQVQYSTSKKFTAKATASKTVQGRAKTSVTLSKLKAKKTYYVRIRTCAKVGSKTLRSSWSKAKTVKTK